MSLSEKEQIISQDMEAIQQSADRGMDKAHIYTMEFYSAIKKNK